MLQTPTPRKWLESKEPTPSTCPPKHTAVAIKMFDKIPSTSEWNSGEMGEMDLINYLTARRKRKWWRKGRLLKKWLGVSRTSKQLREELTGHNLPFPWRTIFEEQRWSKSRIQNDENYTKKKLNSYFLEVLKGFLKSYWKHEILNKKW